MASPSFPPPSSKKPNQPLEYFEFSSELKDPSKNKSSNKLTHWRRQPRPSRSVNQRPSSFDVFTRSNSGLGFDTSSKESSPMNVVNNHDGCDSLLDDGVLPPLGTAEVSKSGCSSQFTNFLSPEISTTGSSCGGQSPLNVLSELDGLTFSEIECIRVLHCRFMSDNVDKGYNVENEMENSSLEKLIEQLEKELTISHAHLEESNEEEMHISSSSKVGKGSKQKKKKKKDKEPTAAEGKGKQESKNKNIRNKKKGQQENNETEIKQPKYIVELNSQEIENDLYATMGIRPKNVHKDLDVHLAPGSDLDM